MTQPAENIVIDGDSVTFTFPAGGTLTFNNAFDRTTGIATMTITPFGGASTLAGLMNGRDGVSPTLQIGGVTTLAAGASATASLTQVAPSVYSLTLGIPQGAAASGTSLGDYIQGGIAGLFNDAILIFDSVLGLFVPTTPAAAQTPAAVTLNASSVNSTTGTGAGPRQLASISFPSQKFPWTPQPSASCVVTGTVNTVVNLQAYITNSSGQQVGIGHGVPNSATQTVTLIPGVPTGSSSGYGKVAANTSATIVLYATQTASTTDEWSTDASTTTFQCTAQPVQS